MKNVGGRNVGRRLGVCRESLSGGHGADPLSASVGRYTPQHCSVLSSARSHRRAAQDNSCAPYKGPETHPHAVHALEPQFPSHRRRIGRARPSRAVRIALPHQQHPPHAGGLDPAAAIRVTAVVRTVSMTVSPCVSKSADRARMNSFERRSREPCGRPLPRVSEREAR